MPKKGRSEEEFLRALRDVEAGETGVAVCVVSLMTRWLLGTHQGAIGHDPLDAYLDEFTFRFNRRKSASRGKLFYRLAQPAVQVEPVRIAALSQHKG